MKTFRKAWKWFWEPALKAPIMQWLVALIMATLIWFVYYTSWKKTNKAGKKIFRQYRKKPAIFVFWHGRSMMLSPIVTRFGINGYAVASRHSDGRMMAKLQRMFGLRPIYGSTSEGGVSVLRAGVKVLRGGKHMICLSPDGPGGPSLRMQDGALYFAKMTGAPIIPVCYSCNRAWFQERWDRYLVAPPFSRIKCHVADPVFVDSKISKEDFEKKRIEIEDIMVKQLRDLDAEFSLFKVEQDLTSTEFKNRKREAKAKKK
jgi:lysophospholipid acyltransferase (LPLAT)-like uncharacterized protein